MRFDDGRVVSNFVYQALTNQDITIYGDGTQTRSFCFIDDLVEGLLRYAFSNNTSTGPINLGNPNEITMNTLAQEIIQITDSKSKVIFKELPKDDPQVRCPDITTAKALLAWEPKISLTAGIQALIRDFKQRLKI
jgi:UDP-glucuronate decarboxylase